MTGLETSNPYQPPTAELGVAREGAAPLPLPRTQVWLMVLLTVFTLGLYMPHWLYTRTKRLKEHYPGRRITTIGPLLLWGLSAISITMFGYAIATDNLRLEGASDRFDSAINLGLMVAVFGFRALLLQVANRGGEERLTLHWAPTLFFSILYLQWKLNREDLTT